MLPQEDNAYTEKMKRQREGESMIKNSFENETEAVSLFVVVCDMVVSFLKKIVVSVFKSR